MNIEDVEIFEDPDLLAAETAPQAQPLPKLDDAGEVIKAFKLPPDFPENAKPMNDGSFVLTLDFPVTLRFASGDGTVKTEDYKTLHLKRMTGATYRAVREAPAEAFRAHALSVLSGLSLGRATLLEEKMDPNTTLTGLNEVLGELSGALAGLKAPAGLLDGMQSVVTETDSAVTAAQQLGTVLDEDAQKLTTLQSSWKDGAGTFLPPAQVDEGDPNRPSFIPPGTTPPDEPGSEGRPRQSGSGGGDVTTHLLMAVVEASLAKDAAENFAGFNSLLTQTAIKEGFSGSQVNPEVARLTEAIDTLAMQTGNSSMQLAQAYYFLTTTGMNKQLIGQLMPSLAQDATAYGNDPMDDAQSVNALSSDFDIPAGQMQRALSILSGAAQRGHFGVGDFGHYLPGLAGQMSILKDGGISGEVQLASALEATRKQAGTSEQDAIDMQDLMSYIASPIASRFFDRTKRSQDLLGAPILDLFKKYHLQGINIPQFLDQHEASGEGSFDAMMDLANLVETELPKNISGSDENEIFRALFHNQQAAAAALAISQNFGAFKNDETALYGIPDSKVQTDFQSAFNSPQGQIAVVNEQFSELDRKLGQDVIPSLSALGTAADIFLNGLNAIGGFYSNHIAAPIGSAIGTAAAYAEYDWQHPQQSSPGFVFQPRFRPPMQLHVIVSPSGQVQVSPKNVPPGTSVTVNQGQVLGVH